LRGGAKQIDAIGHDGAEEPPREGAGSRECATLLEDDADREQHSG
jgi:hypothetical protein